MCKAMFKKARNYPKINEGDMFRTSIMKCEFAKGHKPNLSSTNHKIADMKDGQHFIPNARNINNIFAMGS
jgi:hypothetical protein